MSDSALGGFLSKLKTKAETRAIPVTETDQFFASSKTCSSCGYKKDDLTLSDRMYHCSQCDVSIDSDINAAINLRNVAVGHTETENACGVPNQSSVQDKHRIDAQDYETGNCSWT